MPSTGSGIVQVRFALGAVRHFKQVCYANSQLHNVLFKHRRGKCAIAPQFQPVGYITMFSLPYSSPRYHVLTNMIFKFIDLQSPYSAVWQ